MENQHNKLIASCLFILTLLAITSAMYVTSDVLIPFTLSIFVYFILSPVVGFIQVKLKANKVVASIITFTLLFVLTVLLTIFISNSIGSFVNGADVYKDKIYASAASLVEFLNKQGFNLSKDEVLKRLQSLPVVDILKKITSSMALLIGNFSLIAIFSFFLLAGDQKSKDVNKTFQKIKTGISSYVSIKLALSFFTGGLTYIILLAFNVELAGLIALLTFLFNFIPNVGSIVAMALPLPMLIIQYGLAWQSILVMILLIVLQGLIGNVLEPKALGNSIGLHPVTVLLSLTFWGLIWGIPGMFLSIPITSTLKIVFEEFEFTAPIGKILEGKFS